MRTYCIPLPGGGGGTAYKGGSGGLGRLGKVLLVRIVKNVVVYSSANSLTPSIGRF